MFREYLQAGLVLFGELPGGKKACSHDVEKQGGELVIHQMVRRVDPKAGQRRKKAVMEMVEWQEENDSWDDEYDDENELQGDEMVPYYPEPQQDQQYDQMAPYGQFYNEYEQEQAEDDQNQPQFLTNNYKKTPTGTIPPHIAALILQQMPQPHQHPQLPVESQEAEKEQEEDEESWETEEEEENYLDQQVGVRYEWEQRHEGDDFQ